MAFVRVHLLMDAQPAENDDQTLSRIYSGDDIAGQGLASALHRDDGPSTSKSSDRRVQDVSVGCYPPHVHTADISLDTTNLWWL